MSNFLSPTNHLVKVPNSVTNATIVPKIVLACVHLTTILIKVFVPSFKIPVVALCWKCLKNKLNTFYISNSKCWSAVCFFKSIHRRRTTWSSDWSHTSRCPILRKSDNRRSPSSGGIGGEDPTPGANAVIGNPAVVSPSTLFLFKAPEASLPLSRRVIRELHLDTRIRRGRFTVLTASGSHHRGCLRLPSTGLSEIFMSLAGSTQAIWPSGSP